MAPWGPDGGLGIRIGIAKGEGSDAESLRRLPLPVLLCQLGPSESGSNVPVTGAAMSAGSRCSPTGAADSEKNGVKSNMALAASSEIVCAGGGDRDTKASQARGAIGTAAAGW